MATRAIDSRLLEREFVAQSSGCREPPAAVKVHFDGGRRDNVASLGWVVFVSHDVDDRRNPVWLPLAQGSTPIGDRTVVKAELSGASEAVHMALEILSGRGFAEMHP